MPSHNTVERRGYSKHEVADVDVGGTIDCPGIPQRNN